MTVPLPISGLTNPIERGICRFNHLNRRTIQQGRDIRGSKRPMVLLGGVNLAIPALRLHRADTRQEELFSGHRVVISIFEGPLDLLLYLVRRREVDVLEVDISEITRQFMDYVAAMDVLNIERTGEFAVTAATLMHLKSCMLLPTQEAVEEEPEDELETEVQLARHLVVYRGFQEAAHMLAESRERRQQVFMRACGEEGVGTGLVNLGDVSVFDILRTFKDLLKRAEQPPPTLRLPTRKFTVAGQIAFVLAALRKARGPITFQQLFPGRFSRQQVVLTFVAILELLRRRQVVVRQRRPYDDLSIQLKQE